jgi:predicted HNH restriction endonuclease
MGKKLPHTPRSRIRAAVRQLWLRSRERAQALKDHQNCCGRCGVKQSMAKGKEVKLEVHHLDGIEWEEVIDFIAKNVLQTPDRLIPLCKECHEKEHHEDIR